MQRCIAAAFSGLLILCIVPCVPAQTDAKKHRDTTATTSQSVKRKTPPTAPSGKTVQPIGKDTTASKNVNPTTSHSTEEEETEEDGDSTAAATHSIKQTTAGRHELVVDEVDEGNTAWELEAKIDYDTWCVKRGVDHALGIPSLTPAVILTHESGLSVELDAMYTLGNRYAFSLWSVILGYEYEFTDWAAGSLQYSRYRYTQSEDNSVASKFNCWTLMGIFDARICDIALTTDLYTGTPSVLYITIDLSKTFEAGNFSFTPTFEACYIVENLHLELPHPLPSKDIHIQGFATISLQCEIDWQVTDRLALSLNPQFTRFPIGEIAPEVRVFSSTLTVSYTLDF